MEYNKRIAYTVKGLLSTGKSDLPDKDPIEGLPMLSLDSINDILSLLYKILFPGYFGDASINKGNLSYHLSANIDKLSVMLFEQMKRELSYTKNKFDKIESVTINSAKEKSFAFIEKLPQIKEYLRYDVEALYVGDPAAKSFGEIIYCYPGIRAMTYHRIAHELLNLGFSLSARIIAETAHSETGIDIHPGAQIGKYFSIDHGTGVVIGETCIIGDNVKIYQGVTLGAKSFPVDKDGNPIKGIIRHPIIEDNVVIYSGATILGRITIGKNSIIGGNVWVTNNVAQNSKLFQRKAKDNLFSEGGGI